MTVFLRAYYIASSYVDLQNWAECRHLRRKKTLQIDSMNKECYLLFGLDNGIDLKKKTIRTLVQNKQACERLYVSRFIEYFGT